AWTAAVVVLLMMLIVSLWVPALDAAAADRWGLRYPDVDWSRLLPLSPIPILVLVCFWQLFRSVRRGDTYRPHFLAGGLFLLGFIGLLIGIYPYMVPYTLSYQDAAAAPNSQSLLLVGAVIMLPIILAYTGYVYWVFRGKVAADAGYHH
ncbi:MAG: cytochrome d ubiquinol oxidase subunit II, partial [Gammaproteobacteria bacterium]